MTPRNLGNLCLVAITRKFLPTVEVTVKEGGIKGLTGPHLDQPIFPLFSQKIYLWHAEHTVIFTILDFSRQLTHISATHAYCIEWHLMSPRKKLILWLWNLSVLARLNNHFGRSNIYSDRSTFLSIFQDLHVCVLSNLTKPRPTFFSISV